MPKRRSGTGKRTGSYRTGLAMGSASYDLKAIAEVMVKQHARRICIKCKKSQIDWDADPRLCGACKEMS